MSGSEPSSGTSAQTPSGSAGPTLASILRPSRHQPTAREAQLRQQAYLLRAPPGERRVEIHEELNTVLEIPARPSQTEAAHAAVQAGAEAVEEARSALDLMSRNLAVTQGERSPPASSFVRQNGLNPARSSIQTAAREASEVLHAAQHAAALAAQVADQLPHVASAVAQTAEAAANVAVSTATATGAASGTVFFPSQSLRARLSEIARGSSKTAGEMAEDSRAMVEKTRDIVIGIPEPTRQSVLPAEVAARSAARAATHAARAASEVSRAATNMAAMPWFDHGELMSMELRGIPPQPVSSPNPGSLDDSGDRLTH